MLRWWTECRHCYHHYYHHPGSEKPCRERENGISFLMEVVVVVASGHPSASGILCYGVLFRCLSVTPTTTTTTTTIIKKPMMKPKTDVVVARTCSFDQPAPEERWFFYRFFSPVPPL